MPNAHHPDRDPIIQQCCTIAGWLGREQINRDVLLIVLADGIMTGKLASQRLMYEACPVLFPLEVYAKHIGVDIERHAPPLVLAKFDNEARMLAEAGPSELCLHKLLATESPQEFDWYFDEANRREAQNPEGEEAGVREQVLQLLEQMIGHPDYPFDRFEPLMEGRNRKKDRRLAREAVEKDLVDLLSIKLNLKTSRIEELAAVKES